MADETQTALDAESADDAISPRDALRDLEQRLVEFFHTQRDVSELQEVGDGIYGFHLAGTPNGVSLMVNLTP